MFRYCIKNGVFTFELETENVLPLHEKGFRQTLKN